jgi:hypothetical protein
MLELLREPLVESFRPMKSKDLTATRVRLKQVRSSGAVGNTTLSLCSTQLLLLPCSFLALR